MRLVLSGIENYFANQPIDMIICLADMLGIKYLDLWVPKNTGVEDVKTIKRKINNSGKEVTCVTTWSHLCLDRDVEKEKKLVKESLKWAMELGSERINTYFGHISLIDDKKAKEIYKKNLVPLLKIAEREKIKICIENEFNSRGHDDNGSDVTRDSERMLDFVKEVNSPFFRVTYDPTNFYLTQEEAFPYAYNKLKDYIEYVHLKDARKYDEKYDKDKKVWTDEGRKYVFVAIGEGAINWNRIINAYQESEKDKFFCLEPHTIYTSLEKETTEKKVFQHESDLADLIGERVLNDYKRSVNFLRKAAGEY